ncbi:leukocyte cell-derived chemotaxin 1 [Colossoma macropomum]|uniref:leukocyte cell-derived chemotaxin 1 n=1 Tax=Colossoma macropomum TaxID=42526 RepID=UPI001864E8E9|nr:leukocyte cell-derived chemotaxin 1 [Colossoma macropomum]
MVSASESERDSSCGKILLAFTSLCEEKQVSSTMGDGLEKTPTTPEGPGDVERALSPACGGSGLKPLGNSCLWRTGVAVLITGAGLILLGAIGAFHLWKDNGKQQVISVHYSVSVNGKQANASMEIDSANNLERIRTASGDGEVVEVHDFQAGVTAVWFSGEDKCYIRSQTKAKLPELGTSHKDSVTIQLEEMVPLKSDEDPVIWVASQDPVTDRSFLSSQIQNFCRDLPVHWLHATHPKAGRRRRDVWRVRRQSEAEEFEDGGRNVQNVTASPGLEEDTVEAGSAGSAYNPENPYHRRQDGETGTMVFDPMLDHRGICCTECQRSHTHCERICEPLGGYWPWPYNYHGCRVACRVILPCRWWAARMMGLV